MLFTDTVQNVSVQHYSWINSDPFLHKLMEKKNSRFIRILIIVQVRCSIRFLKSDFVLVLKKYYSSCFSSFKIYYPTLWHFIINTKYNDVSRSRSQGQEDKNNDNALKLVRKESVRTRTKISEASRARNRHATGQFVVAYSSDCSSSLKNGLLRGWRRNEEKQLNNCHPVEAWSRWSYVLYKIRIGKRRIVTSLSPSLSDNLHSLSVDSPLWCRGMASYRQIEQETASSSPQVVERHSWYHVEGQSHKWRSTEKNRTNTSWEGDLRWLGHVTRMDEVRIPKQALHWEVAGFRRRPDRPRMNWRDVVKKDLQRIGLTRVEVEASDQDRHWRRQRVAGPMHRWCWMNQVELHAQGGQK